MLLEYQEKKERIKETEKIFEETIAKNFPELTIHTKTTDPVSSENTTQDKQEKQNKNLVISYLNFRKHKKRENHERSQRKKIILPIEEKE